MMYTYEILVLRVECYVVLLNHSSTDLQLHNISNESLSFIYFV